MTELPEDEKDFFIFLLPLMPVPFPPEPALFCLRQLLLFYFKKIFLSRHNPFTLCPNQSHKPLLF